VIARIRRALNINGVKDLEPLTVRLDARWGEGTSICENQNTGQTNRRRLSQHPRR